MTDEIIEDTENLLAVGSPIAFAGYNIATIKLVRATPIKAYVVWGPATGVYNHSEPIQTGTKTYAPDGTFNWYYEWVITGVQQQAATPYFYEVIYGDGTNSSELTWTQPGLNSSPSDLVIVFPRAAIALGTIANIATKGARQGWLQSEDYSEMQRLIQQQRNLNKIVWADGR